jgi:hypothetical protein
MFTFQQSQLHFVMCGQPFIILSTKFWNMLQQLLSLQKV